MSMQPTTPGLVPHLSKQLGLRCVPLRPASSIRVYLPLSLSCPAAGLKLMTSYVTGQPATKICPYLHYFDVYLNFKLSF